MNITLDIRKPILRLYLDHLFTHVLEKEALPNPTYKVTKSNDFGSMLCSFVRYTTKKPNKIPTPHTVHFQLPQDDSLSNARNYHLYYTAEDQLKLNDLLRNYFNLDLNRYYMAGLRQQVQKKEIIRSFIYSRKLSRLLSDNETLKKRLYREELKDLDNLVNKLRLKAYRHNETIEFQVQNIYAN